MHCRKNNSIKLKSDLPMTDLHAQRGCINLQLSLMYTAFHLLLSLDKSLSPTLYPILFDTPFITTHLIPAFLFKKDNT